MHNLIPKLNSVARVARRCCSNRTRMSSAMSPQSRGLASTSTTSTTPHFENLQRMYKAAPIRGLFNDHDLIYDKDGKTSLPFQVEKRHCHTAGSLHGSGYFKLLDDAAFFAAQGQEEEKFIFTVSFNTYMVRAVSPGTELVAMGWTTSVGKTLILAESKIVTKEGGKLVASGSGSFLKSPHDIASVLATVE